ncbi:MAG: hypothetical protein H7Y27_08735 [Gemmatimonadaceae bacterium]|nr:hypothetical protein [Chitinophagaceae bacterium]
MNTRILLLALSVAALSSCSSVYKTGQTPDDVYYSPAKERDSYVEVEKTDRYEPQGYQEFQDNYRNDRFLRLSVRNRYYMNSYNDYGWNDWRYNTYAYNWNSPWNSYYHWNSFYNPYCMPAYYYYPKGGGVSNSYTYNKSRPSAFNYNSYTNNNRSYSTPVRSSRTSYYYNGNNNNNNRYNNSNNASGRHLYNNSNTNSSSNSSSTPSRSYTPSSSSGSSSSGSGSGGGSSTPPSRPGRGG